jgi:hypothetical protein
MGDVQNPVCTSNEEVVWTDRKTVFHVVLQVVKCIPVCGFALAPRTVITIHECCGGLMVRNYIVTIVVVILMGPSTIVARDRIHITHAYANTNAQSLIGLPMGSHKTVVDMKGNLHWSQWSLKRRGLDVPFGFSAQMDGTLAIQVLSGRAPARVTGQHLYHNRFPFVVTHLSNGRVNVVELAFSTEAARHGLDVVRIRLKNTGDSTISGEVRISGKRRNLPAFATGTTLATHDDYLVAMVQAKSGSFSTTKQNLLLDYKTKLPAHSTAILWLKCPYSLIAKDKVSVATVSGSELLKQAVKSWEDFWAAGTRIELPEQEIKDFYDSSLTYVLILT